MRDNILKHETLLICLALAIITLIAFEQVRHNEFINYDDGKYVTSNDNIQKGLNYNSLKWAFTTGHCANWHPLTWISHMIDWQIYGNNAGGHHLNSLLLHILSAVLLFYFLNKMTDSMWPSAFVAVLFAVHPLHVESVAWAAERKDTLSGLFWVLTIGAYFHYTKKPNVKRYLLTMILFAFGLMAKPMVVTLPFVLLLLDYWPLNRLEIGKSSNSSSFGTGRLIIEKIPLVALVVVSCVITFFVQEKGGAMEWHGDLPFNDRLANAFTSYINYIIKMFYPVDLALFYPHPANTLNLWKPVICCIILAAITVWMIYYARRKGFLLTGWLWYMGTLVPVIGIVQVGGQAMADRYTYLPSIGIFITIAWGISTLPVKWRYQKISLAISACLIIAVLLIYTRMQVKRWKDCDTLYRHTLEVTEGNVPIHYNLGMVLAQENKFHEAKYHFERALEFFPDYPDAENNLGNIYLLRGDLDNAILHYSKAVTINSEYIESHYNLGISLVKKGEFEEAEKHFLRAIELDPELTVAYFDLGKSYEAQNKIDLAIDAFKQVLKLEPLNITAKNKIYKLSIARNNP